MRDIVVRATWRDRLEQLAGRRRDTLLVAAIVAAIVLGGLALWSRGAPARVAPPATSNRGGVADARPVPTPAGVVLVHVAGAVKRPGLYELPSGARVADAVDAAGGPRPRGDLDRLNLAEALADGVKIEVPARGAPIASTPLGSVPSPSPSVAVIDLNQADQVALESIPGVGPVTATAILEYRAEIGSFSSVDQLLEVSGIGPVTLENIRPYVTV